MVQSVQGIAAAWTFTGIG